VLVDLGKPAVQEADAAQKNPLRAQILGELQQTHSRHRQIGGVYRVDVPVLS